MNNLSSYCGLVDARIRASDKDLPVQHNPELGFQDQQVGRIAAKSANFVDYVQKCFVKLGLQLKVCNFR